MSAETVRQTSGSDLKYVSDEKRPENVPIRSKPALQNALTDVKTAFHIPSGPKSGTKRIIRNSAPAVSKRNVPKIMRRASLITPDGDDRFSDCAMSSLARGDIFLLRSIDIDTASIMNPSPPIWTSRSMTLWPSGVQ